jgi:hypothetical protein
MFTASPIHCEFPTYLQVGMSHRHAKRAPNERQTYETLKTTLKWCSHTLIDLILKLKKDPNSNILGNTCLSTIEIVRQLHAL